MLMITFLASIQNIVIAATPIDKANLKSDHVIPVDLEFFNGDFWGPMECQYICYTNNGKKYPAYCISHGLDGVDEQGPYTVDISKLLDDDRIWRVIVNGYPYQNAATIGVENADDAYFATKQAIYCVLINRNIDAVYRATNSSGTKVIKAIKKLTDIGKNGKQTPESANLKVNKNGSMTEDGNYYSQKYTVTSAVTISKFNVTAISKFPEGSFVANNSGTAQTSFNEGETFKVMIPKNKLTNDINGTISVSSKCKTYPIFFRKDTNFRNTKLCYNLRPLSEILVHQLL